MYSIKIVLSAIINFVSIAILFLFNIFLSIWDNINNVWAICTVHLLLFYSIILVILTPFAGGEFDIMKFIEGVLLTLFCWGLYLSISKLIVPLLVFIIVHISDIFKFMHGIYEKVYMWSYNICNFSSTYVMENNLKRNKIFIIVWIVIKNVNAFVIEILYNLGLILKALVTAVLLYLGFKFRETILLEIRSSEDVIMLVLLTILGFKCIFAIIDSFSTNFMVYSNIMYCNTIKKDPEYVTSAKFELRKKAFNDSIQTLEILKD